MNAKKILIIHFINVFREFSTLPKLICVFFLTIIFSIVVALCMQSEIYPRNAIILSALLALLFNFHVGRKDYIFVSLLYKRAYLIFITEYVLLFTPLFISYIYFGKYLYAIGVLFAICLIGIVRLPKRATPIRALTWVISRVSGNSIEWLGGLRTYYILIIPLIIIAGYLCFKEPYMALFVLLLIVVLTQPFYSEFEPVNVLHIHKGDPRSFIIEKINVGYFNLLKICSPILLLYLLNQYHMWYLLIYFFIVTYLYMVLVVSAKYSYYAVKPTIIPYILPTLGIIGVILPPFIPLTISISIYLYFSAKTNLKEYLYVSIE